MSIAHPICFNGQTYYHVECKVPSGEMCVACKVREAGTLWGPHFCPDCDVLRLNRITAALDGIGYELSKRKNQ